MIVRPKTICFAILLSMILSGCYVVSNSSETSMEATEITKPFDNSHSDNFTEETNEASSFPGSQESALGEDEFWELIQEEIDDLLVKYNLFAFRIGTEMPYINYYVEFGYPSYDGKYTPVGLTNDECATLKENLQKDLVAIISQYKLDEGSGIWNKPSHTMIGLFIYNRFTNTTFTPAKIDRHCVSGYQIDLLEYYYENNDNNFVKMDYFDSSPWEKFEIYTPKP